MRLHYEEFGAYGPTLLLFHGYLSSTATWRAVLPRLAKEMRVVAIDLPGAGYSDRPADAPYTLPWIADLLPEIASSLGTTRLYLGGHSLGGAVALHGAARHPGLVAGLVLVSPLVYSPRPPPGLRFARRHPRIARTFFSSTLGRAFVSARLGKRAGPVLAHLDARGGWEAAMKTGLRAGIFAPDQALLSSIRQPALIFWGRQDRVHPFEDAARVCADLAGPRKVIAWEDATHYGHEGQAVEFAVETGHWILTCERPDRK
jgi:pimeloyl-ACP methyl ester carboxylesterase